MCLTCGCGVPDYDMGNPDNITTATLRKAAKAAGLKNIKQAVDNFNKTYSAKLKGTTEETKPV